MFFQVVLCPIRICFFLFKKKWISVQSPLTPTTANKEFSVSNLPSGEARDNALGSLYKQNNTPKKRSKKADKQCKLSQMTHTYFLLFKM